MLIAQISDTHILVPESDHPAAELRGDCLRRTVADINQQQLDGAPRDESLSVQFGGHETFGLYENDHGQPESTMVAKINADSVIEIEIVGMSLSDMLGIGIGESVTVCW